MSDEWIDCLLLVAFLSIVTLPFNPFHQGRVMARTKHHRGQRNRCVSRSCRNHGGCPWCEGNRLHQGRKAEQGARDDEAKERGDGE